MKAVIIEDQAIIQSLVRRVLEEAFAGIQVFSARAGQAGVRLCRDRQPDLVLLDLELPDAEGHELVAEIRRVARTARIVILSAHTESYVLHRVREMDVDGFVDKNEQTPEMLAAAVQAVAAGGKHFSPSVQDALLRHRQDPQAFFKILSQREQEMLRYIGQGASDDLIANRMGLSELTVRNHRRNIMTKLEIHSTPELIRYALEHGFSRLRLEK